MYVVIQMTIQPLLTVTNRKKCLKLITCDECHPKEA